MSVSAKPLDGAARIALADLLTSALNRDRLRSTVMESTGDDVFVDYVDPQQPLRPIVHGVVDALLQRGTLPLFLRAVARAVPARDDLRGMITALFPGVLGTPEPEAALSLQRGGQTEAGAPQRAGSPGLERNVRPNLARISPGAWIARLQRTERSVCRVEIGGNAAGTGFLVGPRAVLTNYHVVEHALANGVLSGVACRFGYQADAGGARPAGDVVAASACLDSLPYAPAEAGNDPLATLPDPDQLDFALLELDAPPGVDPIPLPAAAALPAPGDPLLILQHADGGPLTLAMDTQAVQAVNANATRIRYFTNTEPGSSGAPCFSMEWDLLALHHLGDPAWHAAFNQGVPIGLIRSRLEARLAAGVLA